MLFVFRLTRVGILYLGYYQDRGRFMVRVLYLGSQRYSLYTVVRVIARRFRNYLYYHVNVNPILGLTFRSFGGYSIYSGHVLNEFSLVCRVASL